MRTLVIWVVIVFAVWITVRVVRFVRKERYFASPEFLVHRESVMALVAEHNDVAVYAAQIRDFGTFQMGASDSGRQAHLATFQNTSTWNYQRHRNNATYGVPNVHNCSLQIVRNASQEPLKYVMKYFGMRADESTLAEAERLSESVSRLEATVKSLTNRETEITESVNPPRFIRRHYEKEFMSQVGVTLTPIHVPYPVYVFEYVSAGGNSSQRSMVTFDPATVDILIETLGQKIRWRKSAAGQRALMTSSLRNAIKSRDGYACKACHVSVADEPHLLLEVDHILPVSRGGLSTIDNLQTLCWRCNRSKSNKVG